MRVLLVDLAKTFGGAEVRVLLQAAALQERVEACGVAVLADSELHRRLTMRDVLCHPIEISRGSPRMLPTLRGIIRNHGYQVIDAHNVHSIFWGHLAALWDGVTGRVATIHSDYGREYPGIKGWGYEASLGFNRWVARQYIAVTEPLHEKYMHSIQTTLIHNAVEVPPQPANTKRTSLFFSPQDFIVAIIGRLVPVKGHRYLIEAFSLLADLPHVKLVIVGDGTLRQDLTDQVQQAGLGERVHFAGFRDDVTAVLDAVDCVCMASLSEAMPFVVLEAAAQARPLIVTQVGGLVRLLQDRQTALMVAPQNAAALAQAIRELASTPTLAAELGHNAYTLVKTFFSTDAMIEQVLAVYQRAL